MQAKEILKLAILLIAILLIVSFDDIASARNNKKIDQPNDHLLRPVPTPRPIPDTDGGHNMTPAPSPVPSPTVTLTPSPTPVSVWQPAPVSAPYDSPDISPMPTATPVPSVAPGPSTIPADNNSVVLTALPASASYLPTPLMPDFEPARTSTSPVMIISGLMGIICVCFLAYLSYIMIRK